VSEDTTQNMPDGRSFEERVFARFDSLDARIQALESQAERRALETKPIWERALAEIGEVKVELGEVKIELGEVKERLGALEELTKPMLRKIDLLNRDMLTLRAEQIGLENRLDKLEPNVS
jgi:chromosome segregation ATPase